MGETREGALTFNLNHKLNPPFGQMAPFLLCFALVFTPNALGANRQSGMDVKMRAKYRAAAPLNHTAKITRTGSVLRLDYELVGTDGKKYDLWKIHDQSKPTFSVYQNNVKIGGGAFEFG
ncbi:MAG: hypothetical protein P8Z79_22725 [Sedimentisphaerales bacterium]